jgi:hypothetical protein
MGRTLNYHISELLDSSQHPEMAWHLDYLITFRDTSNANFDTTI